MVQVCLVKNCKKRENHNYQNLKSFEKMEKNSLSIEEIRLVNSDFESCTFHFVIIDEFRFSIFKSHYITRIRLSLD